MIKSSLMRCGKFLILLLMVVSCGSGNIFKTQEKTDPAVKASVDLENNDSKNAKSIILNALGGDFKKNFSNINNTTNLDDLEVQLRENLETLVNKGKVKSPANLVSILASAQAQEFGVEPFSVALRLATNKSTSSKANLTASNTTEMLTSLFGILPESTQANIRGLDIALMIMRTLRDHKTLGDKFKEALFLTSSLALVLKSIDTNGDGQISLEEALGLTDEGAALILNLLSSAISVANSSVDSSQKDSSASSSVGGIQKIQDEINIQPGKSQIEKLKNYLASNTK